MIVPRPIHPILDGYTLSDTVATHEASVCCRAVENATGSVCILKVISVPASAVQMDALLMTGAFPDRAGANAYYKEQARAILNEAKSLRHLATLSYFADFDSVQVVPDAQGNGYEVYLLAPQRTCLQDILGRKDVTQLEIVNMALDVCAALSACRHSGFFYADLKPSNIFYVGQHYCIGDLGLLPLSHIGRTPLSEQYRGDYTPPELKRGRLPLNDTADVYALGMILYEAYNGGVLPGKDDVVGKLLAPPRFADYEMAEIILRACAPDPSIRWHDPQQMEQALSRYLQRNGLHNTSILPSAVDLPVQTATPDSDEPFLPEQYDDAEFSEPLWPSEERTPAPTRQHASETRKSNSRRAAVIGIILALTALFLIELVIGICLLLRRERSENAAFAQPYTESADTAPSTYETEIQIEGAI